MHASMLVPSPRATIGSLAWNTEQAPAEPGPVTRTRSPMTGPSGQSHLSAASGASGPREMPHSPLWTEELVFLRPLRNNWSGPIAAAIVFCAGRSGRGRSNALLLGTVRDLTSRRVVLQARATPAAATVVQRHPGSCGAITQPNESANYSPFCNEA